MMILISSFPIISMAFKIYDVHIEVYEMLEEDETKEKIVFSYDEEIPNQAFYNFQKQVSPIAYVFFSDFKPEVPFPPPKDS